VIKRVIFIVGIKTPQLYLRGWRKDLSRQFPESEVVFIDDWYMHWQRKRIAGIIKRGATLLADGVPTLIIAHSFGGLLARAMLDRSNGQHAVQQLVTMASPHTMPFLFTQARAKLALPLSPQVDCVQTWGGYFDPIVPFGWTSLPLAQHRNLPVEHLAWLFSGSVRRRVLRVCLKSF